MSELKTTMRFGGAALALALLAFVTAPRKATPDAFVDQGEPFFADFTDPNVAKTLEVIEFDEDTAAARPFKVTNQGGRWTIPSHHDYPDDGKDRLAKTAAGVIGIRKDDFRTDNVADHEETGVLDPLDESITTLKGRGKRVTIKGENEVVLADFIIGNKIEGRENLRFVRIPDQKRVYAVRIDIDISTKFEDWIEKDLLEVDRNDIDRVVLKDYSINERTLRVDERDEVILDKDGSDWKANKTPSSREVDSSKMSTLLTAVDDLTIVGVRPKPEGLSERLERLETIQRSDLVSLQNKGFYFTRDGSLLSNEGELQVRTDQGILYTLRFGEILYGSGDAVTAGSDASDDESSGPGENRYLFITADFQADLFPEPRTPSNTAYKSKEEKDYSDEDRRNKELGDKHEEWAKKVEEGRSKAEELSARFGKWYYVISAESFDKIHLKRSDLTKSKES